LITAKEIYNQEPDSRYFYQGDVITGVPYPFWPTLNSAKEETKWGVLRPHKAEGRSIQDILKSLPTLVIGRAARDVTDLWTADNREYIVAGSIKMNLMILTRGCTLDNPNRKHFAAVPVIAIAGLAEAQRTEEKLKDLRDYEIPHNFFLPEKEGLAESYADFLRPVTIHRSFLDESGISKQLVARLSSVGTALLQSMLSAHFGTKFGFDHEDMCPQDGNYSCSNCFHSGIQVKIKLFVVDKPFGHCEKCGEDAMWIKLPSSVR
jgi:hypothetical protein